MREVGPHSACSTGKEAAEEEAAECQALAHRHLDIPDGSYRKRPDDKIKESVDAARGKEMAGLVDAFCLQPELQVPLCRHGAAQLVNRQARTEPDRFMNEGAYLH